MAQQKSKGQLVGIEAKIEYSTVLDDLGFFYESYRRTALNWLQSGKTETEVKKQLHAQMNLPWAWADAIALEAKQTYDQLQTAKDNQIALLKERIKAKTKHAKQTVKDLEKKFKSATKKGMTPKAYQRFENELKGVKSKLCQIKELKQRLVDLEETERLHICFGSRKLFNAQHHLEANGYSSHAEWLESWQLARSGRFFCVGKSQYGGGTAIKIFATDSLLIYRCEISLPYNLREDYGNIVSLNFSVDNREGRSRKADLDYALEQQKPITVQVFRREHKDEQWYIHLSTYVPEVPIVHAIKNGSIGIDFNRDSIALVIVKPDGNITSHLSILYEWKDLTTGQREARMRDIVKDIVQIAEAHGCAIAIEALDFTKKKAKMSEESKAYNEMLSNLATGLFRECLESRCKRYGVQIIKVNPAFTSVIGMIKFMARYGLTSGTAAAMCIARRAMHHSERLPKWLQRPEDLRSRSPWHGWNALSRYMRHNSIRRHQLFEPTKALEGYLRLAESGGKPSEVGKRKMNSPSLPVAARVVDTIIAQSPMGRDYQQLSLFDSY